MKDAYVDPSCLVALAFGEGDSKGLARPLASFDPLISSNLLEAGLCSAIAREEVAVDPDPLLAGIERVLPDRPLSAELQQTLASGYLRGGDCWHLACALLLREELPELPFLTLDLRQREVAARLGFGGLPS